MDHPVFDEAMKLTDTQTDTPSKNIISASIHSTAHLADMISISLHNRFQTMTYQGSQYRSNSPGANASLARLYGDGLARWARCVTMVTGQIDLGGLVALVFMYAVGQWQRSRKYLVYR